MIATTDSTGRATPFVVDGRDAVDAVRPIRLVVAWFSVMLETES
jgi:hypothetical protein